MCFLLNPCPLQYTVMFLKLSESNLAISPLVKIARLNEAAEIAYEEVQTTQSETSPTRTRSCKISPHQLDKALSCPRCTCTC